MRYDLQKFVWLKKRAAGAVAASRDASQALRDAVARRQELEQQANTERESGPFYKKVNGTKEEVLDCGAGKVRDSTAADLQDAVNALATAKATYEEANRHHAEVCGLVTRLEKFLEDERVDLRRLPALMTATRRPLSGSIPSLDELTALRSSIADARRERKRVIERPISQVEAHGSIDAWLADVAALAAPNVSINARGASISLLYRGDHSASAGAVAENLRLIEAWIARLAPDALRQQLIAQAEDKAQQLGGWGPSPEERRAALATIEARLFDLERREEDVIDRLDRAGFLVTRRADADPRAVLALDDAAVAATA